MILPIGHEDGGVARAPRVTLGIVTLCLLAHLWVVSQGEADRELEQRWVAAVEFALAHPELRRPGDLVPPEVAAAAGEGRVRRSRESEPEAQRRLDDLVARWREARAAHPLFRHGLVPAQPRPHTLLTHAFLHGGWLHVLGNLLMLWLAAPFLEEAWGRRRFALFYLAAAIVAGGLYALQHRALDVPLIGASGAVAGVLGAFLLLRARSRIRFLVFFGVVGTFTAPAWVMLPLWFVFELFDALAADVVGAGSGGVAYWAHVWGFLFGLCWAAAERRARPRPAAAIAPPPRERPDPRVDEAQRLLDRGLYPRAWTLLAEAAAAPGAGDRALATWWNLAVHLGREGEALAAGRELLRRLARAGHWQEAVRLLPSVSEHLRGGDELPAIELRLAEAAARAEPRIARGLVARALAGDLAPALRERAERLRERLDAAPPAASPASPRSAS